MTEAAFSHLAKAESEKLNNIWTSAEYRFLFWIVIHLSLTLLIHFWWNHVKILMTNLITFSIPKDPALIITLKKFESSFQLGAESLSIKKVIIKIFTFFRKKLKTEYLELNFRGQSWRPNSEKLLLRPNTLAFGRPLIDDISSIFMLWRNKTYIKVSRNRRYIQSKIGVILLKDFHHIVHCKFQGPQTFRIDDAIISSLMIECSYAPKLPIKICTVKGFAEVYYNKVTK
jgi:hypothetical protein